ncbi:uncharacterized protein SPSK_08750 [Sporothrix schenckii 1099-18]|uniref:Uncharacterized protein n=1 Tax=Sporothrix schenckii 1099-18 TaxID=1397361 RepID=A0A0F2M5D0_SPOSC|nr:uncharacterized protein SPSK_08750 [Sporothrix schenckii 1099-18]KJR84832.1 hypothetical protein SPSK_08750 [Sporothrix schenckii 1099-18]
MAFHQPTRQALQRPPRQESQERDDNRVSTVLPAALEGSQTWVLFSPNADTETTSSALDSLQESSQQTAGRSRLSDLGSLRSLEHSDYASSRAQSAVARPANLRLPLLTSARSQSNFDEAVMSDDARPDAEDDAELDSLDSHLPDFRPTTQQNLAQQALAATATTTVNLPTHDGLGTFRLGNTTGLSAAVQEHLYSFEQFNPRRVPKRRRASLDLAQLQADDEFTEDIERTRRIEAWRLEHSRVLLEEIQKETRRRRGSELSARRSRVSGAAANATLSPDAVAADRTAQVETSTNWHDQEEDDRLTKLRKAAGEDGDGPSEEGLWTRITRRFMLEVMGIDDRVLSVLFGEDISADEEQADEMDLSSTPRASNPLLEAGALGVDSTDVGAYGDDSSSWQLRMLERIAKELGLFVHSHISSHPGAFSTFTRVQQMPLPYAGLPVIPETTTPANRVLRSEQGSAEASGEKRTSDITPTGTTASLPHFKPTIYQAQPMDIPGQTTENNTTPPTAGSATANSTSTTPTAAQAFTQEEWEQDLDIKLVFRYLRSRFFSGSGSGNNHAHRHHLHHLAHHGHSTGGSGSITMSSQEAAAKVARVRQHHPLVGRGASGARQTGERRPPMPAFRNMNTAGGLAAPSSPILRHGHGHGTATSCASQSTRRSARRSSMSSRHSSRHYWDIGGSIGTGSMIASAGPMGSWGEV